VRREDRLLLIFIGDVFWPKSGIGVCSLQDGRGGGSGYSPTSDERKSLLEEGKSIYLRFIFGSREPKSGFLIFPEIRRYEGVRCGGSGGWGRWGYAAR
jgi:hypothetical protein